MNYSKYYDVIYANKDYREEAEEISAVIKNTKDLIKICFWM